MQTIFRLLVRIVRRFRNERLIQVAAALAFATLLALVPMVVVAASLNDHIPVLARLGVALERFIQGNLLPDKAGVVITKVMSQFANRATRITYVGMGGVAITAVMQMLTIERAFDAIWRVRSPRPLLRRVAIHLLVLFIGPLILGGTLAAGTYLVSTSLGLIEEPAWLTALLARAFSIGILGAILSIAYWGVPNRRVLPQHAITGGALATVGFIILQKLFATYVAKLSTFTLIYGPFSVLPVFLIWIHASWSIILLGAVVTAELPRGAEASG